MQPLKTKEGKEYKVISIVVKNNNVVFICIDRAGKPYEIPFDQVAVVGK